MNTNNSRKESSITNNNNEENIYFEIIYKLNKVKENIEILELLL